MLKIFVIITILVFEVTFTCAQYDVILERLLKRKIEHDYPEILQITEEGIKACFQPYDDPDEYESVLFKRNATYSDLLNEYFAHYPSLDTSIDDSQYTFLLIDIKIVLDHVKTCHVPGKPNARNYTFKVGIPYGSFSSEKNSSLCLFSDDYVELRRLRKESYHCNLSNTIEVPDRYDFRDEYPITEYDEVPDQSTCGSCYAFGAIGVVEGAYLKQKRPLKKPLSAQHIVEFSSPPNRACDGGTLGYTYDFILKNGIAYEEDFPYKAVDTNAKTMPEGKVKIKQYCFFENKANTTDGEENIKRLLLQYGPVNIAYDTSDPLIMYYKSGIYYTDKPYNGIDHSILLVGYDENSWIIRNSYGKHFGEKGYWRVERKSTTRPMFDFTVTVIV